MFQVQIGSAPTGSVPAKRQVASHRQMRKQMRLLCDIADGPAMCGYVESARRIEPDIPPERQTPGLRALEKWKAFRFRPLSEHQELRRFVLTRYNEEIARKAEGIVHNLQAKYDTYIKGTTIEEQTEQALRNLETVLHGLGLSLQDVAKTTVFLKDLADFQGMNGVYARLFGQHRPARTTIAVRQNPLDALVEIECIAAAALTGEVR